jgi:hypothetical protein
MQSERNIGCGSIPLGFHIFDKFCSTSGEN